MPMTTPSSILFLRIIKNNMRAHVSKFTQPMENYNSLIACAALFGVVVVVSLLSRWCVKRYPPYTLQKINTLLQDAMQWGAVADQDTNPLLSLIHATYALSNINVARLMVSDQDIENIANMHAGELHKDLQGKQGRAIRRLHKKYPKLRPKGSGGANMGTGWIR
jgi:hypothetical protein